MFSKEEVNQIRGVVKEVVDPRFEQVYSLIQGNSETIQSNAEAIRSNTEAIQSNAEAIQSLASHMDVRFDRMEAKMASKDYVDRKIGELRGDINLVLRRAELGMLP